MCVASQDRLSSESESISSQVLPRVSQAGSLHRAQKILRILARLSHDGRHLLDASCSVTAGAHAIFLHVLGCEDSFSPISFHALEHGTLRRDRGSHRSLPRRTRKMMRYVFGRVGPTVVVTSARRRLMPTEDTWRRSQGASAVMMIVHDVRMLNRFTTR